MARGLLVVLEGPEGAGKTTQLRLLAEWLGAHGQMVVALREPGGTVVGDEIRRILLDPASDIVPRSEALLFMASRAQLVEREIRPVLDQGAIVLIDRFFLATYAYQGIGRGLPEDELSAANVFATQRLQPDLTLLLMLPVEQGLERAIQRGERDRMERAELEFHERVAHAFDTFAKPEWQRAHPECGPVVIVDARGTEAEVFARLRATLGERWPDIFLLSE
ncbi:MAG TPA: dTMP kinase [Gemmatimonadaceae bacterium]|nr:dTMP kinase [Gemmatimonadaceae bacterium]